MEVLNGHSENGFGKDSSCSSSNRGVQIPVQNGNGVHLHQDEDRGRKLTKKKVVTTTSTIKTIKRSTSQTKVKNTCLNNNSDDDFDELYDRENDSIFGGSTTNGHSRTTTPTLSGGKTKNFSNLNGDKNNSFNRSQSCGKISRYLRFSDQPELRLISGNNNKADRYTWQSIASDKKSNLVMRAAALKRPKVRHIDLRIEGDEEERRKPGIN